MKNGKRHLIAFDLHSGVPIPLLKYGCQKYDWPLGIMKVGECFYVPSKDVYDVIRLRNALYAAMREWRQTGRRFVTRNVNDKRIGVWRIA